MGEQCLEGAGCSHGNGAVWLCARRTNAATRAPEEVGPVAHAVAVGHGLGRPLCREPLQRTRSSGSRRRRSKRSSRTLPRLLLLLLRRRTLQSGR